MSADEFAHFSIFGFQDVPFYVAQDEQTSKVLNLVATFFDLVATLFEEVADNWRDDGANRRRDSTRW